MKNRWKYDEYKASFYGHIRLLFLYRGYLWLGNSFFLESYMVIHDWDIPILPGYMMKSLNFECAIQVSNQFSSKTGCRNHNEMRSFLWLHNKSSACFSAPGICLPSGRRIQTPAQSSDGYGSSDWDSKSEFLYSCIHPHCF